MSEENKKSWDDGELRAIRLWYDSGKGFDQIDKETNLPSGTLYRLVNSIQDYKGTRGSIKRWLNKMCPPNPVSQAVTAVIQPPKKKRMQKKTSLHNSVKDNDRIERQLARELEEARKKIERLEAQQRKDNLRREFLEGQLEEYRKLVKPAQSKKSNTK